MRRGPDGGSIFEGDATRKARDGPPVRNLDGPGRPGKRPAARRYRASRLGYWLPLYFFRVAKGTESGSLVSAAVSNCV